VVPSYQEEGDSVNNFPGRFTIQIELWGWSHLEMFSRPGVGDSITPKSDPVQTH